MRGSSIEREECNRAFFGLSLKALREACIEIRLPRAGVKGELT
jgi:hypothetical protein